MRMENKIREAYEIMSPDENAKERMLQNIKTARITCNSIGKEENRMKLKSKHMLRIAAAAAVVLIVPTVAYATGLFGLHEVSLGKKPLDLPSEEAVEVDMISLQGASDSPEYKACCEWQDFCDNYDTDGTILSQVGNDLTGFEEEYGEYLCYTQEMADKIDEICEKYQLKKLSGFEFGDDYKSVCSRVGIGDICRAEPENIKNDVLGGYFYSDGTFHLEGTAVLTGEYSCVMEYQFMRSMKGTFNAAVLNVGNIDDYEQWEYTTENGETVLLANSSAKSLIFVEKENSFVVVNVLGDMEQDAFKVSNEALEALAEAFDFSVIS